MGRTKNTIEQTLLNQAWEFASQTYHKTGNPFFHNAVQSRYRKSGKTRVMSVAELLEGEANRVNRKYREINAEFAQDIVATFSISKWLRINRQSDLFMQSWAAEIIKIVERHPHLELVAPGAAIDYYNDSLTAKENAAELETA